MSRWSDLAFGLSFESVFPLWEEAEATLSHAGSPVEIRQKPPAAVASMLSQAPVRIWDTVIDGCAYEMWRGSAGDHRFTWGERAVFHLDVGAETLTCGFAADGDAGARRLLCDTVLWSVSLLRGYELLHAGAVSLGGETVAIVAASGGGKTSLVAELLCRGGELLCDDILALSSVDGRVVAHPGPPLMNLPLASLDAMPAEVGRVVAVLGEEAWVEVAGRVSEPRALSAICLLERGAGLPTGLAPHPRGPLMLLPHALALPGSRARLRHRFELLGDLISEVPVLHLTGGDEASPPVLADAIECELLAAGVAR